MHYLWLVFMQAFIGIALTAGDPTYVALTAAGVLASCSEWWLRYVIG